MQLHGRRAHCQHSGLAQAGVAHQVDQHVNAVAAHTRCNMQRTAVGHAAKMIDPSGYGSGVVVARVSGRQ